MKKTPSFKKQRVCKQRMQHLQQLQCLTQSTSEKNLSITEPYMNEFDKEQHRRRSLKYSIYLNNRFLTNFQLLTSLFMKNLPNSVANRFSFITTNYSSCSFYSTHSNQHGNNAQSSRTMSYMKHFKSFFKKNSKFYFQSGQLALIQTRPTCNPQAQLQMAITNEAANQQEPQQQTPIKTLSRTIYTTLGRRDFILRFLDFNFFILL